MRRRVTALRYRAPVMPAKTNRKHWRFHRDRRHPCRDTGKNTRRLLEIPQLGDSGSRKPPFQQATGWHGTCCIHPCRCAQSLQRVGVPIAAGVLYPFFADEDALVMLSDILPTGFECGVLNGKVQPGDTVAIVGAGPIGLAALLTAQFYSPAAILMIDVDANRLGVAKQLGATTLINSADGTAIDQVLALTNGAGADVVIEAVGVPATFDICQSILAAGGRLANIGVHGKPVELHLEKLWDRNVSITTRLVDTAAIPMLLKLVQSGKLKPGQLVTHRFPLSDVMKAYDTFGNAAAERALKVVLTNRE